MGEWETLPYALERRIRVNGVDVLTQRLSPEQWIAQRYLAGHDREAPAGADAWEVYGRHRGGLITADVASPDGSVVIELAGDTPAATFLSAVMVEPAGQRVQVDRVEEARAQWFRSAWPVAARTDSAAVSSIYHTAMPAADSAHAPPLTAVVTPGSGTQIGFSILADRRRPAPGHRRHGAGNGRRPARSRPARRLHGVSNAAQPGVTFSSGAPITCVPTWMPCPSVPANNGFSPVGCRRRGRPEAASIAEMCG